MSESKVVPTDVANRAAQLLLWFCESLRGNALKRDPDAWPYLPEAEEIAEQLAAAPEPVADNRFYSLSSKEQEVMRLALLDSGKVKNPVAEQEELERRIRAGAEVLMQRQLDRHNRELAAKDARLIKMETWAKDEQEKREKAEDERTDLRSELAAKDAEIERLRERGTYWRDLYQRQAMELKEFLEKAEAAEAKLAEIETQQHYKPTSE